MPALGFINSFDELAGKEQRLGRKVANHGLVSALLQYSSMDELHFFLPFNSALKPFETGYAKWLEPEGMSSRVKLIHAANLPAALERGDYLAIHAAELDRYFPELCHLRNRWAHNMFPVTCTTHTLSYWSTQVRNLYKLMPGVREFDSIICTSRAARGYMRACLQGQAEQLTSRGFDQADYSGRMDIVPLGVHCSDFGQMEQAEARARLGLDPERLVILCVGRLSQSDKFDLTPLVGVMSLLADKHDICLVLAGAKESGYIDELQKLAGGLGVANRLKVFPDFESSLKPALYAAADIYLSPADNLQETFGLTILEAMSSGLPVVASDFSGYRDLVEQGETGFLIPTLGPADYRPLDPARAILPDHIAALHVAQRIAIDLDQLLVRLDRLAGDIELRRRMGAAGKKRARQYFDWPVVVARLEELWQELHAQAQACGDTPPAPDICGTGMQRLFGHFCSQAISPEVQVKPGPLMPRFLAGSWANQPLPDLAGTLPLEGLMRLGKALENREGLASLNQLAADLGDEMPGYLVEHLILHGLKYGIFSVR